MISMLRGRVWRKDDAGLVLDVGGVGYRVAVPASTRAELPPVGDETTLHIYTHVREDVFALYGFRSEDELVLFQDIIGVSGVGPRVALTSLSTLPPAEFRRAIFDDDVKRLTTIPGVGKKTAQRLILELKGRLTVTVDELRTSRDAAGDDTASRATDEAQEALVALGYTEAEAADALRRAAEAADEATDEAVADAPELIRRALQYLAG